jgi:hypothetical protein
MNCDRCGIKTKCLTTISIYNKYSRETLSLCDNCKVMLEKFLKGKKLCSGKCGSKNSKASSMPIYWVFENNQWRLVEYTEQDGSQK